MCILLLRFLFLVILVDLFAHEKLGRHHLSEAKPLVGQNLREAPFYEFPAIAFIHEKKDDACRLGKHLCTGTLISDKHVLTAAHCFAGKRKFTYHLYIFHGSNRLSRCGRYKVHPQIKYYEDWAAKNKVALKFRENDVAILEITGDIQGGFGNSRGYSSAFATKKRWENLRNPSAYMVGWLPEGTDTNDMDLKQGILQIKPKDFCKKSVSNIPRLSQIYDDNHLCANSSPFILGEDGDDGGPLLLNTGDGPFLEIVGIFKGEYGRELPEAEKVNVFTSVYHYRDFIKMYSKTIRPPIDLVADFEFAEPEILL